MIFKVGNVYLPVDAIDRIEGGDERMTVWSSGKAFYVAGPDRDVLMDQINSLIPKSEQKDFAPVKGRKKA
jgi:hypothetical protein